jgi:O-antigen biosynthesis protein WbqP
MYQKFGKRYFDILFSLILFLFFFPLLILISLVILFFDNTKIIFSQKRLGIKKKVFIIYKFRSLPINTKNLPSTKIKKIKIKFIGSVIRRTNLDELPQLYNVVKGDMSIVGPRPCLPNQKKLIELRDKKNIFNCKPGLTGLAQVSSYDGMSIYKKVSYDSVYVKKISLLKDLCIIFKTFLYLLKRPPIY